MSPEDAVHWHELPAAIESLVAAWEDDRVAAPNADIHDGSRVERLNRFSPIPGRWLPEHRDDEPSTLRLVRNDR